MAVATQNPSQADATNADKVLSAGELKSMLGQCLKMASENKITAHNTWGLPLIEHLDDLIQEEGAVRRTNFQKASVTLDAGVKIYSYRVDSVHTETFKMLGGLGRAGIEGGEAPQQELGDGNVAAKSVRKKRRGELQPEATLESSLEALNVRKFDLAFAVDPLFHKTSAQFDEGGAHGLLLNNLSVYKGCNIVFDSMDVPDRAVGDAALDDARNGNASSGNGLEQQSASAACVREDIEAVVGLLEQNELDHARIAPVLDDITKIASVAGAANAGSSVAKATYPARELVARAMHAVEAGAEDQTRSLEDLNSMFAAMRTTSGLPAGEVPIIDSAGLDGGVNDDDAGAVEGYDDYGDSSAYGAASGANDDETLGEDAIHWLVHAGEDSRLDMDNAKNMSWTGASHWKYRMAGAVGQDGGSIAARMQSKNSHASKTTSGARNVPEPLDFTILLDMDDPPHIELEKSKRRKRAEPKATAPDDSKTLLPEDYKYAVSTLGKYNLRREYISILYSGSRGAGSRGGDMHGAGDNDGANYDEYGENGDDIEDAFAYGSSERANDVTDDWAAIGAKTSNMGLAQAAHKVEQVEVSYCKAAKQVDVKALKELMWSGISIVAKDRASRGLDNPCDDIRFSDVLATVPADNHAGRLEDLSVHLCFICVLHLANEHGLVVQGVDSLDGLIISNVPSEAAAGVAQVAA